MLALSSQKPAEVDALEQAVAVRLADFSGRRVEGGNSGFVRDDGLFDRRAKYFCCRSQCGAVKFDTLRALKISLFGEPAGERGNLQIKPLEIAVKLALAFLEFIDCAIIFGKHCKFG